jgi:RimJ/RimL family protein N-acetyltransferase
MASVRPALLGGFLSAFLSDGTVNLRPVTRADLPQLAAWRNDPELRARTRELRPLTDVDQELWLSRISGGDRRDFMFVVDAPYVVGEDPLDPGCPFVSTKAVGVVGLCHWDAVNASAEVSFYVGDESERGKGYTKRALHLLHGWGFDALRLHRIYAEVYDFNEPGHAVVRSLGYTQCGRQRDTVWRGGRFASSLFYDLLEHEWRARS